MFNKRSVDSAHSSHGNLSQTSITSCDVLSGNGVDAPQQHPPAISKQRSNSSADIQGAFVPNQNRIESNVSRSSSFGFFPSQLCESWFCYENQVRLSCCVTHHKHVSKNKVAQSVSKGETKSFFG